MLCVYVATLLRELGCWETAFPHVLLIFRWLCMYYIDQRVELIKSF